MYARIRAAGLPQGMVVLPGRGVLGVTVTDGPYILAELAEAKQNPRLLTKTVPNIGSGYTFQALKLIDVRQDAKSTTINLVLDPGKSLTGTIIGVDGRPLKGVNVSGQTVYDFNSDKVAQKSAEFKVTGLAEDRPRFLVFYHKEQQQGAVLLVSSKDSSPLTVRLQKCGSVTGRVLDANGVGRSNTVLRAGIVSEVGRSQRVGLIPNAQSDKDGRFRMDGLVPGVKYNLYASQVPSISDTLRKGLTVRPGQIKELGDLKMRKLNIPRRTE